MRFLFFLLLLLPTLLSAQWEPGAVYREYHWVTPTEGEEFLRVGGRYGYAANPGKLPDSLQRGAELIIPGELDLEGALRAEISLEKVMSHEDSRNLRVAVNGHAPIALPEPSTIPAPQTEYMYHTEVGAEVPLEQLRQGEPTYLALTLDSTQRWNWPQNLVYGITLRVYYAASSTSPAPAPAPPVVQITSPVSEAAYLTARTAPGTRHVDYVFVGRDTDWSGRGVYERTHWQTFRCQPLRILGRSATPGNGFATRWDTRWLPNQATFGVQARALGADGKYRVSEVRQGLALAARPYTVTLYEPGPAPRNWVTRSGEFSQTIAVPDSVEDVTSFRLAWVSWSPCYGNGLFLNGHLLWQRTDDCYVFATHTPEFAGHDVPALQQGDNVLRTALTPLFRGKMVHGMEVQWPGVQLKVRRGW